MPNVLHEYSQIAAKERRAIIRRAFLNSLPVMMGYLTMGFAAGGLMASKGNVPCPAFWAGLCGIGFISGTLSFVIVPAIAANQGYWQIAMLALAINFRYAFYGISLVAKWKDVPLFQKCFLVHSLADEIYALDVACKIKNPLKNRYYCLWNGLLNVGYWVAGTTLGGLAGSELPIPARGIEFTMTALFLVIFTDQVKEFISKQRKSKR